MLQIGFVLEMLSLVMSRSSLTHPMRSILKRNNSVFLTVGQSRDIWPRRVDQTYSHGREHSLRNFWSKTLTGLYFIKYGFHSPAFSHETCRDLKLEGIFLKIARPKAS